MNDLTLNHQDAKTFAEELFKAGHFADAFTIFSNVAEEEPGNWEAAHHAGYALAAQRKNKEALYWYDRAAAIAVTALNQIALNRAEALGEVGRSEEAIRMVRNLLRQYPDHAKAHYILGVLLLQIQEFEEALDHFAACERLDPTAAGGNWRYCQGFAHLVLGRYLEGFAGFRERMKEPSRVGPNHGTELWRFDNITGKTVLVLSATGRGDVIQFGRYVPMLVEAGARVFMIADRGLETLFYGMRGVTVYGDDDVPALVSDHWAHVMDLAYCFETRVETVPPPLGLVYAPERIADWRTYIPDDGVLNVGLCWAGNPESRYDEHRTIPLEMLEPLTELARTRRVRFYGLQQSQRDEDLWHASVLDITHIGHHFTTYTDSACALKCLDLVITVDTSVAHLAGTVGVPTWVLVTRFRTYWLWIKGMTTTPWYPSIELVRQPVVGSWPSTVEIVRDKLLELIASR